MRAVVLSLVAVLVAGGAQAKVCKLDGLTLVAVTRDADAPAAMVGSKFRVVRQASRFKTAYNPAKGGSATSGEINVEVVGDKGRFIVGQDYNPNSMPWVYATSWAVGDPASKRKWRGRNRAEEKRLFEIDGTFPVYGGPLGGLTLEPTNCR